MATAAVPANLAAALRYGPQTQTAVRRSEYLADALRQLSADGGKITGGFGELGSKLLAQAILQHAGKKADLEAVGALRGEQDAETERLIAALGGPKPAPAAVPEPPVIQLPPPPEAQAPQVAPEPAPIAPQPSAYSPQDRDALTRMLATEAIGEGPQGMAAAGHVALNRLKSGYGGAKTLADVVMAPHQFSGMARAGQIQPQDYAAASQVADAILSGQVPDPTNGAINFINPELQAQQGRAIPPWAQGQGQRIGRHVFFGAPDVQMAAGQAPQGQIQVAQSFPAGADPFPPPPEPNGPPIQNGAPQPSAPVSSPPAAGSPAAGMLPQANPAAGGPAAMGITAEQSALAERLLRSPRDHEAGVAYVMELLKKAAEPTKYEFSVQGGVPVWGDPQHPGRVVTGDVPKVLQTHTLSPEEALQLNVPPGTVVQRAPDGSLKFEKPAQGQMAVSHPGEPYREQYIPGGTNDPTRLQPPPQGYGYAAGGRQAPIQGGPADLRNPTNVMEGANRYGAMVKSIADSAMKVRQNFGAVTTGFRQQNGTGDIAMINGLQKLIDEGVVKGEDVNMQMKSNGLEGTLGGMATYMQSGGLLTPDIRQKVFKTASDLYRNLDQTYRVRVQSLQPGFDEVYGAGSFGKYVFPDAFAQELGWTGQPAGGPPAPPPPAAAPTFKAGTADAALAEAVKRKLPLNAQQTQRAKAMGLLP